MAPEGVTKGVGARGICLIVEGFFSGRSKEDTGEFPTTTWSTGLAFCTDAQGVHVHSHAR
jgi:hypothetical protein